MAMSRSLKTTNCCEKLKTPSVTSRGPPAERKRAESNGMAPRFSDENQLQGYSSNRVSPSVNTGICVCVCGREAAS